MKILALRAVHTLDQIIDPVCINIWCQGWLDGYFWEMNGEMENTWKHYIAFLHVAHKRIYDGENELVWDFDLFGMYTPKVGYICLGEKDHARDHIFW